MRRLFRFCHRHRRAVIGAWVLLLLGGVPNLQRATNAFSQQFSVPGKEGFETNQQLLHRFNIDPTVSAIVPVLRLPHGMTVASPGVMDELRAALDAARAAVPGAHVSGYPSTRAHVYVSDNGRTTYATVYVPPKAKRGFAGAKKELGRVRAALARHPVAGAPWHVTGIDALADAGNSGNGPGVLAEALLGGIGALLVLAFVFASFVALMPIVMALFAIVGTFMLMWALTTVAQVSFIVEFLVALIGLGVCIDYALLLVLRWREERAHGVENVQAVENAMATAGEAIVFSGTTVGIGLLSMVVLPIPFLRSIGYAGMLIPVVSVLVAITLLPVLLATIGPRIDRPRLRDESKPSRFWQWWSQRVVRHRWIAATVALGILVALAIPAFSIQIGNPKAAALAKRGDARQGLVALEVAGIGAGPLTEFQALVPKAANAPQVAIALQQVDGVRGVAIAPWRAGGSAVVQVFPQFDASGSQGRALYKLLKQAAPAGATIGGQAAQSADFVAAVYSNFPLMIALIAVLTLILLARAFRSLLLPAKAVALNLLSVAAAWGVLVLAWQDGKLSHLIWGIVGTGSITEFIPLMVFAFLFGLSMDYEVFILSRVREEYDAGGSTDEAVTRGLMRTGRLVTSAALILFLAFAALGSGPETTIKIFATGLAAGIILDATVVRALLVPALVSLFGRWNWWLPRLPARVLRVDESRPVREPG